MYSVNTNLGAQAALATLNSIQGQLSATQNAVSTGKSVSSAADNPAVYAISQKMNADIAGLSAVQSNLAFGAQVVNTANTAVTSINTTLSTLKQTITNGQQPGMDPNQINQSINAALSQINSFANGATVNGVNLIAGATGNGVSNTQLQMLSSLQGDTFTIGGTGLNAMNATSAGLGLSGLNVNSGGATLDFSGANAGALASGTSVTLQTANYSSAGTVGNAQNPGQQWVFKLDSTASQTSITPTGVAGSQDQNGNFTQIQNVVTVGIKGLTAGSSDVLGKLTAAMQQAGFNVNQTNSGTLNVTGNNIDQTASDATVMTASSSTAASTAVSTASSFSTSFDVSGLTSNTTADGQGFSLSANGQTYQFNLVNGGTTGVSGNTYTIGLTGSDTAATIQSALATTIAGVGGGGVFTTSGAAGTLTVGSKVSGNFSASASGGPVTAPSGSGASFDLSSLTASNANGMTFNVSDGGTSYSFTLDNTATTSGNGGSGNAYTVGIKGATTASAIAGALKSAMAGVTALNTDLAPGGTGTTVTLADSAGTHLTSSPTVTGGSEAGTTYTGAQAAIATVSAALTKLGGISSGLGAGSQQISGLQTFSSSLSDALTAGVGALTDADMAAESAKLQSLQTKQQLAVQSLSIANQQPQIILKLFG